MNAHSKVVLELLLPNRFTTPCCVEVPQFASSPIVGVADATGVGIGKFGTTMLVATRAATASNHLRPRASRWRTLGTYPVRMVCAIR